MIVIVLSQTSILSINWRKKDIPCLSNWSMRHNWSFDTRKLRDLSWSCCLCLSIKFKLITCEQEITTHLREENGKGDWDIMKFTLSIMIFSSISYAVILQKSISLFEWYQCALFNFIKLCCILVMAVIYQIMSSICTMIINELWICLRFLRCKRFRMRLLNKFAYNSDNCQNE